MRLPREFVLMVGTACCAFALIFTGATSAPRLMDPYAPLRFEVAAIADAAGDDDQGMPALREQARAALAGLMNAESSVR